MAQDAVERYRAAEARLFDAYGLSVQEHTITVDAPHTSVRVLDVGEGSPILFLHGAPNDAASWVPLVAELREYRCLMADSPGAGLSTRVRGWRNYREETAAIIDAVLTRLQLTQVALVGSSLGGLNALSYALAQPENVSRLIITGTPAGVSFLPLPASERIAAMPLPGFIVDMFFKPTVEGAKKAHREIGHGHSIDAGTIPDVVFEWYAELLRSTDTARNMLPDVRGISTPFGRKRTGQVTEKEIAGLQAPVLYLWGDADPLGKPSDGERLAAVSRSGQIEHFPDFGHLPWLDDPALVAASITRFLQS